jgi:hypothetical protein
MSLCGDLDNNLPAPKDCSSVQTIVLADGQEITLDTLLEEFAFLFDEFGLEPEDFPGVAAFFQRFKSELKWPDEREECPEISLDAAVDMIINDVEWTETERDTEVVEISNEENPDCMIEVERILSITFESDLPNGCKRHMTLNFTGWGDD